MMRVSRTDALHEYTTFVRSAAACTQSTHPYIHIPDLRDHDMCVVECVRHNGRAYINGLTQHILQHYQTNVQDERTRIHKTRVRMMLLNVVQQVGAWATGIMRVGAAHR
jgi:hypothetical protein